MPICPLHLYVLFQLIELNVVEMKEPVNIP